MYFSVNIYDLATFISHICPCFIHIPLTVWPPATTEDIRIIPLPGPDQVLSNQILHPGYKYVILKRLLCLDQIDEGGYGIYRSTVKSAAFVICGNTLGRLLPVRAAATVEAFDSALELESQDEVLRPGDTGIILIIGPWEKLRSQ